MSSVLLASVKSVLAQCQARLSAVPVGRLRLRWHLAAAAVFLLLALSAVAALVSGAAHDINQASATLVSAQADLRAAEEVATRANIQPELALLEPRRFDDVVRDVSRFASEREIRVASLRIDPDQAGGAFSQMQITVSAKGSYPGLKGWLSEMLARYPSLALKSIALAAPSQGSPQVGASFALVLFLKPTR